MRIIKVNTREGRISSNPSISYNCLLKDLKQCNIVNEGEINECLCGVKKNDKQSIDKLVRSYVRFIVSMAKLMNTDFLSFEDLVNEGCIGLIKAARNFNISKSNGNKFLSYAVWYIQAYMMTAINKFDDFIRLPYDMYELRKKAYKISNVFFVKNSYFPQSRELSEIMEVSEHSLKIVLSVENNKIISTDNNYFTYISYETMEIFGVTPLERYIPDDNFADLNITKEDLYIDLKRSIDTLTTVESQVIRLYFGVLLDDYPDVKHALTLEEIGCMLDLHRERVRQIMEKAIRRLKHPGRSRVLRKYL